MRAWSMAPSLATFMFLCSDVRYLSLTQIKSTEHQSFLTHAIHPNRLSTLGLLYCIVKLHRNLTQILY